MRQSKKDEKKTLDLKTPEGQRILRGALEEVSGSLTRHEAERDFRKSVAERLDDEYGFSKKIFNRLAKTYHKQNYDAELVTFSEFQEFYERLFPQTNELVRESERESD